LASCLTNEAATNLLEAEAAAKRQQLIDFKIKKKAQRGNKKKGTRREGTK